MGSEIEKGCEETEENGIQRSHCFVEFEEEKEEHRGIYISRQREKNWDGIIDQGAGKTCMGCQIRHVISCL